MRESLFLNPLHERLCICVCVCVCEDVSILLEDILIIMSFSVRQAASCCIVRGVCISEKNQKCYSCESRRGKKSIKERGKKKVIKEYDETRN